MCTLPRGRARLAVPRCSLLRRGATVAALIVGLAACGDIVVEGVDTAGGPEPSGPEPGGTSDTDAGPEAPQPDGSGEPEGSGDPDGVSAGDAGGPDASEEDAGEGEPGDAPDPGDALEPDGDTAEPEAGDAKSEGDGGGEPEADAVACDSSVAGACDDDDPCTVDVCGADGFCTHVAVGDGTPCSDGDACNGEETCQDDLCTPGAPPACEEATPCLDAGCDASTGCFASALPAGTPCGDDDACNGEETCQGGACSSTAPPDCDDALPCTSDTCDPAIGCVSAALPNGTPCGDGDACNGSETCAEGTCVDGPPPICDDGQPCTEDACDPSKGCAFSALEEGADCSDGDICNGVESCTSANCVAGAAPSCDDGNDCTGDGCHPIDGCTFTGLSDGVPCGDGDPCNGEEICSSGFCIPGTAPLCDDGLPCTVDACIPGGGCDHAPAEDGAPCDDGDACNGEETCFDGACSGVAEPDCDDGNACTADDCDPASGCLHESLGQGASCDDGDVCDGVDTCLADVCTPGEAPICEDEDPCTADACDPGQGCTHVLDVGASCTDDEPCNGEESCVVGGCAPGEPLDCSDGDPCTDDTCIGGLGCVSEPSPNGKPCPDDQLCNGTELCVGGNCIPGPPVQCDDGNPCSQDFCLDVLEGCASSPLVDGVPCEDGDLCNGIESCKSGACIGGGTTPCDDGNPCTNEVCDPAEGCLLGAVDDGTPCPDGDLCNGDETCGAGQCLPGDPGNACSDDNPCTTDSCHPMDGCSYVNLPNEASCSDGDPCTGTESCLFGSCYTFDPILCVDGDPCTADLCDEATGSCNFDPAAAEGDPCDDGNPCTEESVCAGGGCESVIPLSLAWPVGGEEGIDWVVQNYPDTSIFTPDVLDYTGNVGVNAKTVASHPGIDIHVPTFRHMDDDFPVFAAAAGMVKVVEDHHFDRHTSCSAEGTNIIRIDHGVGFDTVYLHLKRDSVPFDEGDEVAKGDIIGVVGSSGCAGGPQVQFEVRDCQGLYVPAISEGLMEFVPEYSPPLRLMELTVGDGQMFTDAWVKDPQPDLGRAISGQQLAIGASLSGGTAGDTLAVLVKREDGSLADTLTHAMTGVGRHTLTYWSTTLDGAPGIWSIEVQINAETVHVETLEVGIFGRIFRHGVPAGYQQTVQDTLAAVGLRMRTVDGGQLGEASFYNAVYEAGDINGAVVFTGMFPNTFDAIMESYISEGWQAKSLDSVLHRGSIQYSVVLEPEAHEWTWYRAKSPVEHAELVVELSADELRPVVISAESSSSGVVEVTALWDEANVGEWQSYSEITPGALDTVLANLVAAGFAPAHLNGAVVEGETSLSAIFDHGIGVGGVLHHGLTGPELEALDIELSAGDYLLHQITGYPVDGKMRYGAIWWPD